MENKEVTDSDLISWYNIGWEDEMRMKPAPSFENELKGRAYQFGRIDYRLGDDIPSINYKTEEQIIKEIRN